MSTTTGILLEIQHQKQSKNILFMTVSFEGLLTLLFFFCHLHESKQKLDGVFPYDLMFHYTCTLYLHTVEVLCLNVCLGKFKFA